MTSTRLPRLLPARAAPLPGESLASLVRRTSQAMGYESPRRILALLATQGQPPLHLNELAPGWPLDYLAALFGQPVETILSLTVHCHAASLVLVSPKGLAPLVCDPKTMLRCFNSSGPICPQCLKQDAVPYERLLWSFRPVPFCPTHGCLLVSRCPACHRAFRWDRVDVSRCNCGHLLSELAPASISRYGVDVIGKVHGILLGQLSAPSQMTPAACFWWAERLAAAVLKAPLWLADVAARLDVELSSNPDALSRLAAAEILVDWPKRLVTFLDVFQRIDKHRSTSTGVGRRFGTLLRHAARLEKLGHPAPADALRHFLVERYDGGHLSGKVCLFKRAKDRSILRKRSWMTQTAAAKVLGFRSGAVAALVQRKILVGKLHPAGSNGRSVGLVSRQSVDELRRDLQGALDVKSVAFRLGIGRHAVLELIHRGVLPRAVRTAKGWQVPRASVARLESFCESLSAGRSPATGWLPLREATRKFGPAGLTLDALVELILSGRLAARMAMPELRLNGIVVSQADLASLTPDLRDGRHQSHGYPVHQLAKVLFPGRPIKSTVVGKWIAAGLLKFRKIARARIVAPEEVARFRAEYCLADEACRQLGITRSTLSRWEAEGRIRPVYGRRVTPEAGFSLYRRADLASVSRRRGPRRAA